MSVWPRLDPGDVSLGSQRLVWNPGSINFPNDDALASNGMSEDVDDERMTDKCNSTHLLQIRRRAHNICMSTLHRSGQLAQHISAHLDIRSVHISMPHKNFNLLHERPFSTTSSLRGRSLEATGNICSPVPLPCFRNLLGSQGD